MFKKMIIIFAIFILITTSFFVQNVKADATYTFGFEDTVAGNPIIAYFPVGSDNIFTSDKSGVENINFATSSVSSRTGTRNFYINSASGWWNTTIISTEYITNFSFYHYTIYNNNFLIKFYNNTLGISQPIIHMAFTDTYDGKVTYYNEVGTKINIDTCVFETWTKWCFNIDNLLGDVSYFYDDTHVNGVSRNPNIINEGYKIDRIYMSGGDGHRIDDISWIMSAYTGNNSCADTIYQSNTLGGHMNLPINLGYGKYIENMFTPLSGLGITGNITDIRLSISNDQKNYAGSLSNYTCVVNGINLGDADGIYGTGNDYKILWLCDVPISNNKPIFSFGCNKFINLGSNSCYWFGLGVSIEDFSTTSKFHNSSAYHLNNLYDGTVQFIDPIYQFTVECTEEGTPPTNTTPSTPTIGTIYFKFYDISTGNIIHFKGTNLDNTVMGSLNYMDALIYSTYSTHGFSNSYSINDEMPLDINFTEGSYITFQIIDTGYTDFECRINGIYKMFKAQSQTIKVYKGQTYAFYLVPTDYIDNVNYTNRGGNDATGGQVTVHLNKFTYDFGETVRIEYWLPTGAWLNDNGWLTNGWAFAFYNRDDYFLGLRFNNWDYINRYDLSPIDFDGNRHTYQFDIAYYNNHGYDEFFNDYEVAIINFNAGIFDKTEMFDGLIFYVTGEDFEPNGTITDITPNPCYNGQTVTFSFESNGVGRLELHYPSGDTFFNIPYGYSDGLHTISRVITGIGLYSVELFTNSPFLNETSYPVDTDTLIVNPVGENGTYGSYGFGLPYLYIPNYRVIAGFDTLQIYYRTYKNDSILKILSPRGETTYFSTTVSNQSDNVLNIEIPNYMQLGTWNVTFLCGGIDGENTTLYTTFNVVNEEGNWIEFSKHVYTTNDLFQLYLKHTYRVAITFYKNDIAQGETIIFNVGEETNTLYTVPITIVKPEVGHWRVEMWRINDRNVVYELAEWECNVVKGTSQAVITNLFGFELPDWAKLLIGVFITLIMTILPILIIVIINRKSSRDINLPALVYVGFFFFGLVVSVLLGFIPNVVIFIVLFGLVIGFAVMWLRGNLNSESSA